MTPSILDDIVDPEKASPYRKLTIFGEPGVGKTIWACTAPKPLVLACEPNGTLSLDNHPELKSNTKVIKYKGINQLEELCEAIRQGLIDRETLVIDTVTELQQLILDEQMIKAKAADSSRNINLPYQTDYRENTGIMRKKMIEIAELPIHVIFTAHVVKEQDQVTGAMTLRPGFTPKVAQTMRALVDAQGYMTLQTVMRDGKEAVVRTIQTLPTPKVQAKSRVGVDALL